MYGRGCHYCRGRPVSGLEQGFIPSKANSDPAIASLSFHLPTHVDEYGDDDGAHDVPGDRHGSGDSGSSITRVAHTSMNMVTVVMMVMVLMMSLSIAMVVVMAEAPSLEIQYSCCSLSSSQNQYPAE